MPLQDPIAAYNAESNVDARMAQQFLEAAGIEAYVTEDNSLVGHWMFGNLPEIHKPQVWVERADAEQVAQLLTEYEAPRRKRRVESPTDDFADIPVRCETCGTESTFAAKLRNSVQDCPHCGAVVDVGELEWPYDDEWQSAEPEADDEPME